MRGLDYLPCLVDPDLWYKAEVRPDDGFEYYFYILCYADDTLVIHHDSLSILKIINSYFKLKPSSIGDPDIYLGAKVKKMTLTNGTWCWALRPSKYVQEDFRKCEQALRDTYGGTYKLPKNAPNPFLRRYKPETDMTTPLSPELSSYYQSLIGIMSCMVEIGRIYIATKVSLLRSRNAYPQKGHFKTVLHVMGYIKLMHYYRLSMDTNYPPINNNNF